MLQAADAILPAAMIAGRGTGRKCRCKARKAMDPLCLRDGEILGGEDARKRAARCVSLAQ